jgi:phosphoglycolate phosphatase-like HAD superfamily hydrolase
MTSVLFWDIDGTLLTTARAGVFALEQAAREVCGVEADFSKLFTAGLTDAEVAAVAMKAAGHDASPDDVAAFLRSYEGHLPERLHYRHGAVLPGVGEILDDLARRPGVICLLLTGNTPAGATAKLRHYGLERYFAGGAFCTGTESRDAIARRARGIAAEHAGGVQPEALFVIGDTPHDVRCGKAIGARTVAVASGPHGREELAACDPWLLLDALPEPPRFRELLRLD